MQTALGQVIGGKAGEIYKAALANVSRYVSPHAFIGEAYRIYTSNFESSPSINGRIFEYAICETLVREGITPIYYQAQFAFAPIAEYDIVCYHPRTPVVLSAKVSLRERYKQAVLEGGLLKGVYGAAQSYLLTLSDESEGVRQKIRDGSFVGLTDCLRADSPEYDELLNQMKRIRFTEATPIIPLTGKLLR